MAIQWFPGHMHKARKEMAKVLPDIDVLIEVLDARIPWSSENPMLAELRGKKPNLRVLCKSDLADTDLTDIWISNLSEQDKTEALAVSTEHPNTYKDIPKRLRTLMPPDPQRIKPRVAMVVGIPNVGKSTLINQLAGRVVAKTGNEPAITKRQQPIQLGEGWILRDTPGVLWPKVDNVASGYRLAATGAIRDTAMDSGEVATILLDFIRIQYGERLKSRFSDELSLTDSVETLEQIGQLRGCLGAGGHVDFDRTGRLLLQEFRSGLLGGITLETPDMRDQEIIETQERLVKEEEKRDAKKQSRRAKYKKK